MSLSFDFEENYESGVKIKVVGIGGGGNNAINHMVDSSVRGVDFIAINTDKQALIQSHATARIPIGEKLTKGHGAGAHPEIGCNAAEESAEEIATHLRGADMVFITAGMGGGTGTGAAPVVAEIARKLEILTIGVVTKPFAFEGQRRMAQAERGIQELHKHVDSLIVIPNERLKAISPDQKITLLNGFKIADDVLKDGVRSIAELINVSGYINLDFADVTSVMKDAGYAHMGVGFGKGKDKADVAAKMAISSPLLDTSILGAKGIIVSITVSNDIGLDEVDIAMDMMHRETHPDANIIFGVAFDNSIEDEMRITVIATGFEGIGDSSEVSELEREVAKKDVARRASSPYGTSSPASSSQTSYRPAQSSQTPQGQNRTSSFGTDKSSDRRTDRKEPEQPAQKNNDEIDDFDNIMELLKPNRNNRNLFNE